MWHSQLPLRSVLFPTLVNCRGQQSHQANPSHVRRRSAHVSTFPPSEDRKRRKPESFSNNSPAAPGPGWAIVTSGQSANAQAAPTSNLHTVFPLARVARPLYCGRVFLLLLCFIFLIQELARYQDGHRGVGSLRVLSVALHRAGGQT